MDESHATANQRLGRPLHLIPTETPNVCRNALPGHPRPAATSSELSDKKRRMVALRFAKRVVAVGRHWGRPSFPADAHENCTFN